MSTRLEICPGQPHPAGGSPVEITLDELLDLHRKRQAEAAHAATEPAPLVDPLESLRSLFRRELLAASGALAEKYGVQGIALNVDADHFLTGGREIVIDIRFQDYGLRLTGTAMPDRIAFQETRGTGGVPGAVTSGAALRTRDLSAARFREFLCEHISALVRSVLRQTISPKLLASAKPRPG